MGKVNILDCTLRDGGYVNNFAFDDIHSLAITDQLQSSGIEIIECGYIDTLKGQANNSTRFDCCETINVLLNKLPENHNSLYVAMAEFGNVVIDELPSVTSSKNEVKGIRLAFRKSARCDIFDDAQKIISKGYKLFIQPMATELYKDQEILELIDRCNSLGIDSIYIVDTHGSMMREVFRRIYYLFEHNLNKSIRLGFHSHNNLQLSYSNAIDFIEIANSSQREIIIDSSIYGMGRGAGNLNTELLADYINKRIENRYKIEPLLEVVDEYLAAIYKENRWGYSLEHFLSASEHCHPNYASFLINKKNLSIVEIKKLLASISSEERREFNKKLIEQLYVNSKETMNLCLKNLPAIFYRKNILLIASGKSVEVSKQYVAEKVIENEFHAVSLNHINSHIPCDYYLFSNQLRYDEFCEKLNPDNLIVTSNIKIRSNHQNCYVVDYKEIFEHNGLCNDNGAILMLNLLAMNGLQEVAVAGLDGYDPQQPNNYSYNEYNRVLDSDTLLAINDNLASSISIISQTLHINYLTPSRFKQHTKQKIIGVIPSRFGSTRLQGKPLKDIAGLPLIIHVLKRAQMSKIIDEVIVATDDTRIFDVVESYGGKAMMTDISHNNGSERMYEVSRSITGDVFAVINGDEALLKPEHIDIGIQALLASDAPVSLLYNRFEKKNSPADFKVVLNNRKEIMYISRNDIPSNVRNEVPFMYKAYHVMSFTKEFLEKYMTLEQTPLDYIESHELLRVLENGYKIQGIEVESSAISVDTPEDLEYVRKVMHDDPIFKHYGVQK